MAGPSGTGLCSAAGVTRRPTGLFQQSVKTSLAVKLVSGYCATIFIDAKSMQLNSATQEELVELSIEVSFFNPAEASAILYTSGCVLSFDVDLEGSLDGEALGAKG